MIREIISAFYCVSGKGTCFNLDFGPGNPRNKKVHIRGIVDEKLIVRWSKAGKIRWEYEVIGQDWLDANSEYITHRSWEN